MRIPLILASLLLASCGYLEAPVLSPYKMDIRQGNYITPEMREKLKPGMSKSQARYVMGTAMVSDVFHNNRWDYVYTLERRGEVIERQHMTLYFDGDTLVRVEEGGKTIAELTVVVPPVAEAEQAKPDISAGILQRVERWAAAWSSKNTGDYLASYMPDYAPQGMSRVAWEKQRLARIGKPKVIEVGLSEMSVSVQDEQNATATFVQSYRSDAYRDVVEKTLRLVKQGDTWLIADERAGATAAVGKAAAGFDDTGVKAAIQHWVGAWSARDQNQYLASYADSFKPQGMSRAKWEEQRRERIGKAGSILVEVGELSIKMRDASHASATFRQDYRSDAYSDSMRKTLRLEKIGDAWLIVAEQAAQ